MKGGIDNERTPCGVEVVVGEVLRQEVVGCDLTLEELDCVGGSYLEDVDYVGAAGGCFLG